MHLPKLVTHTLRAARLLFLARAGDGRAYLEWNARMVKKLEQIEIP